MKKAIVLACALLAMTLCAKAQKFALVDMDYVMSAIPAYETANEQLSQLCVQFSDICFTCLFTRDPSDRIPLS